MEKDQRFLALKTSEQPSTQNTDINLMSDNTQHSAPLYASLIVQDFLLEDKLWKFLKRYARDLSNIEWEVYRRASGSEEEVLRRGFESARRSFIPTNEADLFKSRDKMRGSLSQFKTHLSTVAKSLQNIPGLPNRIEVFSKNLDAVMSNLDSKPVHLIYTEMDHVEQLRQELREVWGLIRSYKYFDKQGVEELAFKELVTRINNLLSGLALQSMQSQT